MNESTPAPAPNPRTAQELRLGLAAWALFMSATCAYCLVHQAFVSRVTPDAGRTLAVALREWGLWAVLAPSTLRGFRGTAPSAFYVVVRCALLGFAAALLPVVVDLVTGERTVTASLALFWPRNLGVALLLFGVCRAFQRPIATAQPSRLHGEPTVATPPSEAHQQLKSAPQAEAASTLLVSKGAHQCLIRIADIEYLCAAGNYVEISACRQRYLIRATMSELESLLPAGDFVRIHRSHIVRVGEIERIRLERSGSGTVHLRGGAQLSVSKSYRAQLKRHPSNARPAAH